jgi:hypothetical protein
MVQQIQPLERLTVHADNQAAVDIDRAEIVDEDSHAQPMFGVEDAVEQRGFARAQKAGEDGQRHRFGRRFHFLGRLGIASMVGHGLGLLNDWVNSLCLRSA